MARRRYTEGQITAVLREERREPRSAISAASPMGPEATAIASLLSPSN